MLSRYVFKFTKSTSRFRKPSSLLVNSGNGSHSAIASIEDEGSFSGRMRSYGTSCAKLLEDVPKDDNPVSQMKIVNCVVMRGFNDDEICDFVELTREKPINIRFIEFMPFDGNVWNVKRLVPYAEMFDRVVSHSSLLSLSRLQDHTKEVYNSPHRGAVSFITSMTEHFCSGCNRLRLLADGNLKVCLFGPSEKKKREKIGSFDIYTHGRDLLTGTDMT
ncbi:hypothetical protein UlMin_004805 [Ulmus minor]